MREPSIRILFDTICAAINNEYISVDDKRLVTSQCLEEVLKLATKHDIAHLIVQGLPSKVYDDLLPLKVKQIPLLAVYRYEKTNYELQRICDVLEKNKIAHLPLKGSVLRRYYPEPWMRTSCDIDILVQEQDLAQAVECLVDDLAYEVHGQFTHDVSLFSKSSIHIELHFDLIENWVSHQSAKILKNVWELSHHKEGYQYQFEMPDEVLYFYHIAHMAKHFENGGCGIRPFLDLWFLDNIDGIDPVKRNNLLSKGELLTFANASRRLSKVWFDGVPMDLVSEQMENYILRGGIYGNSENRILVQQQIKGGSVKYVQSKIWIPYDELKFYYPVLHKHRWLAPFMQIRRWCRIIFCGHLKRTAKELKYNSNISDNEAIRTQQFLRDIGLTKK